MSYLNALPLISGIESLVRVAPPAALAEALHAGMLDVALVPVHEAFVHPGYSAVDGVSIASDGDVFSVVVFAKPATAEGDTAQAPKRIWLDPDSRTSCLLARVLFGGPGGSEYLEGGIGGGMEIGTNASPETARSIVSTMSIGSLPRHLATGAAALPRAGDGLLRIGNPAIQMRIDAHPGVRAIDLGGVWKRTTGRPFVYALWLMRPGFSRAAETAEALRVVARRGAENRDAIAAAQTWYSTGFASRYLHEHIDHHCEERHWAGLQEFRDRAVAAGLAPPRTALPARI